MRERREAEKKQRGLPFLDFLISFNLDQKKKTSGFLTFFKKAK
jgi:hypothetical protein